MMICGRVTGQGPLQYSWDSVLKAGPLDMTGTSQPVLHVSHITVIGDYTFTLTITDSRGQSGKTSVSVVVLPERNSPPVAVPGPNLTVHYPATSAVCNGSASYDDYKIIDWQWTQVRWVGLDQGARAHKYIHWRISQPFTDLVQ